VRLSAAWFVLASMTAAGAAAEAPRVFVLDGKVLQAQKANPQFLAAARAAADKVIARGPFSVMLKTRIPPSGDKHDYMSQAPYFWPDPAKPDGRPYLRKDGERNPEILEIPDHTNMDRMSSDARALALAWYFTGDEKYAARAALVLRAWFLEPATRMKPNLDYAQAIPGVNDGRGIGIIESRGLTSVVDAVGLLAGSRSWTAADQKGLEEWFGAFLKWLRESKNGVDESKSVNNHGTYYDVQVADFALFTHQEKLAAQVLAESRGKRIEAQIEPDGRQPKETDRTRGASYSIMNLSGLMMLASLGEHAGVDFWNYQTVDHRGIRKALDWLVPYISGEEQWPYQQIDAVNKAEFAQDLLRAAARYQEPRYAGVAKKVGGEPAEVEAMLLRAAVK
jgi:Alginate lyase